MMYNQLNRRFLLTKRLTRTFSSSILHDSALDYGIRDERIQAGGFPSRTNTIINFLPQGNEYVIERFGKFNRIEQPGLRFLIPFVDRIAYSIDKREMCLRIDPALATTGDNVTVKISGNLFLKFHDPYKAAYGASNPIFASAQFAQSVMRTAVGDLELDRLFSERSILNNTVKENMQKGVSNWGCDIIRFEITDLAPVDEAVAQSLHKQSTADRERREKVITAEADKKQIELLADAYRYKQEQEAKGDSARRKINAEAQAYEIEQLAEAQKIGIEKVNDALSKSSKDTAQYLLSERYINEFGNIAKESTSLVIPQDLTQVAGVVAAGSKVLNKINKN